MISSDRMSRLIEYNRTIFQPQDIQNTYYPLSVERQIEKQKLSKYQNLILLKKSYQLRRNKDEELHQMLQINNIMPQQKALYFTDGPRWVPEQRGKLAQSYSVIKHESAVNRSRQRAINQMLGSPGQKDSDSQVVFTRDDSKRSIRDDTDSSPPRQVLFYPSNVPQLQRTVAAMMRMKEQQRQKLNSSRNEFPQPHSNLLIQQMNLEAKDRSMHRQRRPLQESVAVIVNSSTLTYFIGNGNNDQVVRDVMSLRSQWHAGVDGKGVNFVWMQGSAGFKFHRLVEGRQPRSVFNHFEHHRELSLKDSLVRSLSRYCERTGKYLFDLTPITFVVDTKAQSADIQFRSFLSYYLANHPTKSDEERNKLATQIFWLKKQLQATGNFTFKQQQYVEKDRYSRPRKMAADSTYLKDDRYIWILKPTFLNRGRGIYLFSSLDELRGILFGSDESNPTQLIYTQFVIQKYIEKPLLFKGRKFDMRVWVLVTHRLELYYCREGYIRTSCEQYELGNLQDQFVHLTNNAIQKHSQRYGVHEQGNQISFAGLRQFLSEVLNPPHNSQELNLSADDFETRIIGRIRELITITFESVKHRLNINNRQFTFEIFGYDFILDEQLQVYLIEVNTNPCIECSSELLGRLIPAMLNEAFKLTIDQIFGGAEPSRNNLWVQLSDCA